MSMMDKANAQARVALGKMEPIYQNARARVEPVIAKGMEKVPGLQGCMPKEADLDDPEPEPLLTRGGAEEKPPAPAVDPADDDGVPPPPN